MRTPQLLFVGFFLLVLTLPSAGQVRADGTSDYLYSFGGNTFAWDLPSNPVIPPGDVYPGNAFTIPDLSFTENGLAMVGTLDFYNISSGGGFDLWTGNYFFLCNAFGPQLYTGPESAPTLINGAYTFVDYGNGYTPISGNPLQATSVAEPSAILLLGAGLALSLAVSTFRKN